jgi:tripeptide aminopeptidase
LEDESFSADSVTIILEGKSAHPGYAKGKMVNALKVLAEFVSKLPKDSWSPETTSGREGFVHPTHFSGGMEAAQVSFIIRDHDTSKLAQYEERLEGLLKETLQGYPPLKFQFIVKEQYRNMKEVLNEYPFVSEYALEAMRNAGIEPKAQIIRGGTDGSRLSFMGLPCPNIFTGEMAIHSRHEYVSVQDMEKAVQTLVELMKIWSEHKS